MLTVGYAQNIITPSLDQPVFLAGFGSNRRATSIHDDLFARALVLSTPQARLAFVSLDLLGLYRPYWLEIQRRLDKLLPHTYLLGACTHVHHAPDVMGLWGPNRFVSGIDRNYLSNLLDIVVKTIQAAAASPQPCWLRASAVHVPGVAKNARNPEIVDDELTCLQFYSFEDGNVLASLIIFPCHPEVLWEGNPCITSDYPGFLRGEIENATKAPCVFFAGALGGMMTPDVKDHSFAEAAGMGKTLAQSALHSLVEPQFNCNEENQLILHYVRSEFTIPLTNSLFKIFLFFRLLPRNWIRNNLVSTEVNLVKIGPIWLAGVPGELLPKLGLAIKAELRSAGAGLAGVIGLANDELGYILPKEDFLYPKNPLSPGSHYEETMSIGPEAGPLLMEAVHSVLAKP